MEAIYNCPKCGTEIKRTVAPGEDRRLENCPGCGELFAVTFTLVAVVYTVQQFSSKMKSECEDRLQSRAAKLDNMARISKPRAIKGIVREKKKPTSTFPTSKPDDDYQPYGIPLSPGSFSVNHAHFRGKLEARAFAYLDHVKAKKKDGEELHTWHQWLVVNCSEGRRRMID